MKKLTILLAMFAVLTAKAQNDIETLWTYEGASYSIFAVSPDQRYLAGMDGRNSDIEIRDLDDFSLLATLVDESGNGHEELEFSPDGKFLALGQQGSVRIWSTETWEGTGIFETVQRWGAPFSFSPDSALLFVGNGASIEKWSIADAGLISAWDSPAFLKCMATSRDGLSLATGTGFNGRNVAARVWSVENGEQLLEVEPSLTHGVEVVAYSPDGRFLVTSKVNGSGPIEVWSTEDGSRVSAFGPEWKGASLAFSENGEVLFSGWGDRLTSAGQVTYRGELRLWDWASGRSVASMAGLEKAVPIPTTDDFYYLNLDGHLTRARLPVWLRAPSIADDRISFEWLGRDGTFQLQPKISLGSEWKDVGEPTVERGMTGPAGGASGFFRLVAEE